MKVKAHQYRNTFSDLAGQGLFARLIATSRQLITKTYKTKVLWQTR